MATSAPHSSLLGSSKERHALYCSAQHYTALRCGEFHCTPMIPNRDRSYLCKLMSALEEECAHAISEKQCPKSMLD